MPTSDLQINSKIREILARHWVDAEKLQFRTAAGTVRFHGLLARQGYGVAGGVNTLLLETLISEMRSIAGVQKVYFTGVEIEQNPNVGVTGDHQSHGDGFGRQPDSSRSAHLNWKPLR